MTPSNRYLYTNENIVMNSITKVWNMYSISDNKIPCKSWTFSNGKVTSGWVNYWTTHMLAKLCIMVINIHPSIYSSIYSFIEEYSWVAQI